MTRKQKKEFDEKEAKTKIELVIKGICVSEIALETLTEKLLLTEMNTMKTEELRLKMERNGCNSEVELLLGMGLEDEKRKCLKASMKKFGKLISCILLQHELANDELKLIFERQEAASDSRGDFA